jgi:hypothetical protein
MAQRIRKTTTVNEFESVIDDYITQGYKVKSRGESTANLVKAGEHDKHILVALLTIWWTFGLGNLVYQLIPMPVQDDVLVRLVSEIKDGIL